ncbi:MAG: hypothetical protein A4E67_00133 [Syntrophaceae bacterium PtaB.Bin038]|nr:MAG: hypothetical protein A4E67_00133 [Syntrophaceae bacterium PtaB.Bin038]
MTSLMQRSRRLITAWRSRSRIRCRKEMSLAVIRFA